MENFVWEMPPKIIFGPGSLEKTGEEAQLLGKTALLVCGKFIYSSSIFSRVKEDLDRHGLRVIPFPEVESNPRTHTVDKGGKLARDFRVDFILAIGGGSAIDTGKAIAVVALSGRPSRDYLIGGSSGFWKELIPVKEALPIMAIVTLAGTGSEANGTAVLTDEENLEKETLSGPALVPRVSIIDPLLTLTVPPSATADGGVDMFTHLAECYLTDTENCPVQNALAEALMQKVIEFLPKAVKNGNDLESRTVLSLVSTLALCGLTQRGRKATFPQHRMEHALSALRDIPHGRGMAALLLPFFRYLSCRNPEPYLRFGKALFGIQNGSKEERLSKLLLCLKNWLEEIGAFTDLKTLGFNEEDLPVLAKKIIQVGGAGKDHLLAPFPLYEADILAILKDAYCQS